jgi:hypothetical protein
MEKNMNRDKCSKYVYLLKSSYLRLLYNLGLMNFWFQENHEPEVIQYCRHKHEDFNKYTYLEHLSQFMFFPSTRR